MKNTTLYLNIPLIHVLYRETNDKHLSWDLKTLFCVLEGLYCGMNKGAVDAAS